MISKNFVITEENVANYVELISEFIRAKLGEAGRKGVVLGMSGGIDCSVVARLCQSAGVNVKLYLLPDGDDMTRSKSMNDAMELINAFSFDYKIINIKEICSAIEESVGEGLSELSKMNIRPRVRMAILYTAAQNAHSFVIGTGNLSERLLGYFTKWGDGASDLNPIGMLTKKEVRIVAKYLKIPESIITKPPSAGLFEGQTDEAELGFSYEQIDSFILNGTSGDQETDARLAARTAMSEHKLKPIAIFDFNEK